MSECESFLSQVLSLVLRNLTCFRILPYRVGSWTLVNQLNQLGHKLNQLFCHPVNHQVSSKQMWPNTCSEKHVFRLNHIFTNLLSPCSSGFILCWSTSAQGNMSWLTSHFYQLLLISAVLNEKLSFKQGRLGTWGWSVCLNSQKHRGPVLGHGT